MNLIVVNFPPVYRALSVGIVQNQNMKPCLFISFFLSCCVFKYSVISDALIYIHS